MKKAKKWIKIVLICLGILGGVILLFVFRLPIIRFFKSLQTSVKQSLDDNIQQEAVAIAKENNTKIPKTKHEYMKVLRGSKSRTTKTLESINTLLEDIQNEAN